MTTTLRIAHTHPAAETELLDWQHIHNTIIPTAPLGLDAIRTNAGLYRLDTAYLGDTPIGCATVRPPDEDTPAATVIARILPAHRRQGHGTALYNHGLAHARTLGVDTVETIILASNTDGLRFAEHHGFTETERDLLPGDTIPFVTLALRLA
ncbi:GNAT family N-acetyltransferase [Yinghuangia soli]|uniref:GNAT family N-acetyltransferase n=1 Tax=Yinghuangia soli TaxID=2908204 RepID=A0AA41Q614_9ACTN|nr:GNAT family N-acetyltransferase [Yinghuangia soli]MCF2530817.1 GNAT family N-acetyltransferase [Yinghuangia soli]